MGGAQGHTPPPLQEQGGGRGGAEPGDRFPGAPSGSYVLWGFTESQLQTVNTQRSPTEEWPEHRHQKARRGYGTYQHSKGDDLEYTLHGEHGCEHDVQTLQHQLILVGRIIELPKEEVLLAMDSAAPTHPTGLMKTSCQSTASRHTCHAGTPLPAPPVSSRTFLRSQPTDDQGIRVA